MSESQSRKLAAILAADIAGYGALMGSDEPRTVRDLKGHQAVVLPMIGEFGGRIIDTAGDGILADFSSVVSAVECAVAIQGKMAERNATIEPERRMQFRIGINVGDVIFDETRIYGDGINIAARLEAIAEPEASSFLARPMIRSMVSSRSASENWAHRISRTLSSRSRYSRSMESVDRSRGDAPTRKS